MGSAAFQHEELGVAVAVRAAGKFPCVVPEYGVIWRVTSQRPFVCKLQPARRLAFAHILQVVLIGVSHDFVAVQLGLHGALRGQAAVELLFHPVVQMPVARYRISYFGFVADGFVFPVFAVAGFGFKLDGAEG